MQKGVKVSQLTMIAVKFLNENSEKLHLTAGSSVSNALNEAFPPSYKDDGTSYCPE